MMTLLQISCSITLKHPKTQIKSRLLRPCWKTHRSASWARCSFICTNLSFIFWIYSSSNILGVISVLVTNSRYCFFILIYSRYSWMELFVSSLKFIISISLPISMGKWDKFDYRNVKSIAGDFLCKGRTTKVFWSFSRDWKSNVLQTLEIPIIASMAI